MGSHMRPEITSEEVLKRQAKEEIEEIAYRCEEDFEDKHKKLKLKQKKQYMLYRAKVIKQNEKEIKLQKSIQLRRTEMKQKREAIEDVHQKYKETWKWTIDCLTTEPQKEHFEKIYRHRLKRMIATCYETIIAEPMNKFSNKSLSDEITFYKQRLESEKTSRNNHNPNLEEAGSDEEDTEATTTHQDSENRRPPQTSQKP